MEFFHKLYNGEKICYNANMHIRTSFKNHIKRLRQRLLGVSLPKRVTLRGVRFADRQGALAQSRNGDLLQVVHTPLKKLPHNVYVYHVSLNRILGYIEQPLAKKLVKLFGKNFCRDGKIVNRTGGPPYPYYGCVIDVYDSMEYLQSQTDFTHLHGE